MAILTKPTNYLTQPTTGTVGEALTGTMSLSSGQLQPTTPYASIQTPQTAPTPTYSTGALSVPPPSQTVPSSSLTPTTAQPLPNYNPERDYYNPLAIDVDTQAKVNLQNAGLIGNVPVTDTAQKQTDTQSRLLAALDKLTGKTTKTAELTKQEGLPEIQANISSVSNQIKQIQRESATRAASVQGAGGLAGARSAKAAEADRQAAIEINKLSGTLLAYQGDEAGAIARIQQALSEEFGQAQDELEYLSKSLEIISAQGTKEEKARAEEQKLVIEERKRLLEEQMERVATVEDLAFQAAQNGAPMEIIAQIRAAKDPIQAAQIAGQYGVKATGISAEYQTYVADQTSRGLPVMSFDEYQTRDANRKIAANQIANDYGMNATQQARFLSLANQYNTSYSVKHASKAYQAVRLADQLLADPSNASKQIATLYNMVKTLDPDSVVREGEVNLVTAAESFSNRFSTTLARVNERKAISNEAAIEMARAVKDLAEVVFEQAELAQRNTTAAANVAGLGEPWADFLSQTVDFGQEAGSASGSTITIGGQSFSVGQVVENDFGQRARVEADGTLTPIQ